jgi:putative tryptophan/tyrosine transport system substrate-binding protein
MKRRNALLVISAAVAFTLVSRSFKAQGSKVLRIGYLTSGKPGGAFDTFRPFREGLLRLGYVEGRNVVFEVRYGVGQVDQLAGLAAELLRLDVDIIALSSAVALRAVKRAGATIPIVFAVVPSPDAVVEMGFAASVERPGGNITGISSFDPYQAAKSFQLLKELLPDLRSVAILSDQDIPRSVKDTGWNPLELDYDRAARAVGLLPHVIRLKGPAPNLEAAFAVMAKEQVQALRVLEVPVPLLHLDAIANSAKTLRLPTMLPGGYPNSGALISYGTSIFAAVREMPVYVDRIAKGAKPGDLPIKMSAESELVINLETAREIGVVVPPEVMKRASRVL